MLLQASSPSVIPKAPVSALPKRIIALFATFLAPLLTTLILLTIIFSSVIVLPIAMLAMSVGLALRDGVPYLPTAVISLVVVPGAIIQMDGWSSWREQLLQIHTRPAQASRNQYWEQDRLIAVIGTEHGLEIYTAMSVPATFVAHYFTVAAIGTDCSLRRRKNK